MRLSDGKKIAQGFPDPGCRLRVLAGYQPPVDDDPGRPVGRRMMMRTTVGKRSGEQEGDNLFELDGPFFIIGEGRENSCR